MKTILVLLCIIATATAKSWCLSAIPSAWGTGSSYVYQSSGHCSTQCLSYKYMALYNGNVCICGNTAPDTSKTGTCDTTCTGYGQETCGGSDSFQVEEVNGSDDSSDSSSSAQSSSTSAQSSSTSSDSSSSSSSTSSGSKSTSSSSPTTTHDDATVIATITLMATESGSAHMVTVTVPRTTVSTSTSTNSAGESGSSNNKAKLIGPIVGGVIGGLAALSVLALVIFFIRRQRKKDRDLLDADANIIATMKRNENNNTHSRQLSNPFADDFVDPGNNTMYGGNYYKQSEAEGMGYGDGEHQDQFYDEDVHHHLDSKTRLAVVNPDKD